MFELLAANTFFRHAFIKQVKRVALSSAKRSFDLVSCWTVRKFSFYREEY